MNKDASLQIINTNRDILFEESISLDTGFNFINYNLSVSEDINLDFGVESQNGEKYLGKGTYIISIKTDNTIITNQFKIK